ncbi:unnamed protein product [Phaeothamnion confervicola]
MDDFDDQLHDSWQYDNPDQSTASLKQQLKGLGKRAWAVIVYMVVMTLWLFIADWVIGTLFGLSLVIAAAPLLRWWRSLSHAAPLDLVVRSFGLGFVGMFWSVNLVLIIVVFPIEVLFVARSSPLLYLLTINASIVGIEELHRALLARWIRRDVAMGRETKAHQLSYTATSVGYATAAALTSLIVLDHVLDALIHVKHDSAADLGVGFLALLCVIACGTPLHVLSGYLIGLETTAQTPLHRVALYPFVLRTVFLYQTIGWLVLLLRLPPGTGASAVAAAVLLVAMLATNVLICWAMLRRIKRVEGTLPVDYLQRVGYLNAFGYGVLPGAEPDGNGNGRGAVEIPISRLV